MAIRWAKAYNIRYSQAVTHPSTNRRCLASQIGRDGRIGNDRADFEKSAVTKSASKCWPTKMKDICTIYAKESRLLLFTVSLHFKIVSAAELLSLKKHQRLVALLTLFESKASKMRTGNKCNKQSVTFVVRKEVFVFIFALQLVGVVVNIPDFGAVDLASIPGRCHLWVKDRWRVGSRLDDQTVFRCLLAKRLFLLGEEMKAN